MKLIKSLILSAILTHGASAAITNTVPSLVEALRACTNALTWPDSTLWVTNVGYYCSNSPTIKGKISSEIAISNRLEQSISFRNENLKTSTILLYSDICYSNTTAKVYWGGKEFPVLLESKELWRTNRITWK